MSRSATAINAKLWVWNDNDNPGAGTKGTSKVAGGTGLNANWESLDYLFTQHNDDGTHKDATIKGSNLIQTGANAVVDEATIEFSTNKMRVKDASITGAKLATTAADASTLEVASGSMRIKDAGVTGAKLAAAIVDSSTIEIAANILRVKDAGIVNAKLSHDNTRLKTVVCGSLTPSVSVATYLAIGNVAGDSNLQLSFYRPGAVTSISLTNSDGAVQTLNAVYSSGGADNHFAAGDKITVTCGVFAPGTVKVLKNGNWVTALSSFAIHSSGSAFVTIEIEWD